MSEAHGEIDFAHPPTATDPEVLYSILDLQVSSYLPEDTDRGVLLRAYRRAGAFHQGAKRDSGEPYVTHPLHVALILSHLELDLETLAAALLHDTLEDTKATHEGLAAEFGPEIADLVQGVTKLSQVSKSSRDDQSAANIQTTACQHIAMTWSSGNDIKLYVNGVEDQTGPIQATLVGTTIGYDRVLVGKGCKNTAAGTGWNGLIDDVQIYNYALTGAEIAAVMAGGTIPTKSIHYPISSPAEIYQGEEPGSRVVNFKDYAQLMNGLKKSGVEINRKLLADMAVREPAAFASLVTMAKDKIQD